MFLTTPLNQNQGVYWDGSLKGVKFRQQEWCYVIMKREVIHPPPLPTNEYGVIFFLLVTGVWGSCIHHPYFCQGGGGYIHPPSGRQYTKVRYFIGKIIHNKHDCQHVCDGLSNLVDTLHFG